MSLPQNCHYPLFYVKSINQSIINQSTSNKISGDDFPDLEHKLQYLYSRLEGAANDHLEAFFDQYGVPKPNLTTTAQFFDVLTKAFGEPNKRLNARRKVAACKQKDRAFSEDYAEFLRYAADSELGDDNLRFYLTENASHEIRHTLALRTGFVPDTLPEVATLCQDINEALRAIRPTRSATVTTNSGPATVKTTASTGTVVNTPTTTVTTTATNSKPSMDRKLTDEEKARRFHENLCMYCGRSGHQAKECPAKNLKPSASVTAIDTGTCAGTDEPEKA